MSRSTLIILLGMGAGVMTGLMLAAAFLFGRNLFVPNNDDSPLITPLPIITQTPTVNAELSVTPTITVTAVADDIGPHPFS